MSGCRGDPATLEAAIWHAIAARKTVVIPAPEDEVDTDGESARKLRAERAEEAKRLRAEAAKLRQTARDLADTARKLEETAKRLLDE